MLINLVENFKKIPSWSPFRPYTRNSWKMANSGFHVRPLNLRRSCSDRVSHTDVTFRLWVCGVFLTRILKFWSLGWPKVAKNAKYCSYNIIIMPVLKLGGDGSWKTDIWASRPAEITWHSDIQTWFSSMMTLGFIIVNDTLCQTVSVLVALEVHARNLISPPAI